MPMIYDPIPETYEEALAQIYDNLTADEKAFIRGQPNAAICHMPFIMVPLPGTWNISGMGLRNAWNLWGVRDGASTTLREEFISRFKLGHADDMSGMILDEMWSKVKGDPFDRDAAITRYHAHWARYGVDPVTQEEI